MPPEKPYSKFTEEKMILRDYLAADRTVMANERTFLAYIRTALSIFAVGASFLQFFNSRVIQIVGWIFIPVGIIIFIIGLIKYWHMKNLIDKIKKQKEA